eukprot:CAMPEP_0178413666 /NCGR_PEP_ID=MMETSP0689_2-20121128/22645_1 /TAXON_ID=160604 /ORGANISM="Amphidinium massartii, Strain CS-259" /LENGTH=157 /DNA_ID=CAMNT_0020034945 /DNA_START=99 /DNA_END=572 /DNA_ORIENTATION=-
MAVRKQSRCRAALLAFVAAVAGVMSFSLDSFQSSDAFTIATADTSGIRNLKVIGICGRRMKPYARHNKHHLKPGDLITVTGRSAGEKGKILRAIVVRTREGCASTHKTGFRTQYDQNAAVIVNNNMDPVSRRIVGPVDKKACLRWPKLASIARDQIV